MPTHFCVMHKFIFLMGTDFFFLIFVILQRCFTGKWFMQIIGILLSPYSASKEKAFPGEGTAIFS